jgi:hypothetical protein
VRTINGLTLAEGRKYRILRPITNVRYDDGRPGYIMTRLPLEILWVGEGNGNVRDDDGAVLQVRFGGYASSYEAYCYIPDIAGTLAPCSPEEERAILDDIERHAFAPAEYLAQDPPA